MSELEALRMRDEVLQALYWMRGEGLGSSPTVDVLSRFLVIPEQALAPVLDRIVDDGFIERTGDGYALTEAGASLGGQSFAEEFDGMTKPGHGECDADCWCHDTIEAAERCHAERAAGRSHGHSH